MEGRTARVTLIFKGQIIQKRQNKPGERKGSEKFMCNPSKAQSPRRDHRAATPWVRALFQGKQLICVHRENIPARGFSQEIPFPRQLPALPPSRAAPESPPRPGAPLAPLAPLGGHQETSSSPGPGCPLVCFN